MLENPDASSNETIRGDPSHTEERHADREYDKLLSSGFGQPFLFAIKLRGDDRSLHLGVLIQNPEAEFAWANLKNAPLEIQELAAATSTSRALAWRSFSSGDGSRDIYFDPSNKADAWVIGTSRISQSGGPIAPSSGNQTSETSDLDSDLFAESLDHSEDEVSELTRRLKSGVYEVSDSFASQKTRGSAQRVFAAEVKKNYGWKCALTGIQTRSFLIASHIVPWSVDEKIRLDPSNGICLSVLVDRAFENGILVVDDDLVVTVNRQKVGGDVELMKQLQALDGKKIDLPKAYPPKTEYLRRRRGM